MINSVGYIEFVDPESVSRALLLKNQKLLGIPIIVELTEAEKNRAAQAQAAAALTYVLCIHTFQGDYPRQHPHFPTSLILVITLTKSMLVLLTLTLTKKISSRSLNRLVKLNSSTCIAMLKENPKGIALSSKLLCYSHR